MPICTNPVVAAAFQHAGFGYQADITNIDWRKH
jgi:hypothetical protein